MQPVLSLLRLHALTIIAVAGMASAQQPPQTLTDLANRARVIFRGQVVAVRFDAPHSPGEIASTLVTFRVRDGIRGATTGATLTIRQWNAAPDEYRVGEELVLFLHAPSNELGLTSPVGGRAGHRRVEEVPDAVLEGLRSAPPTADAVEPAVVEPNDVDVPLLRGKPLPRPSRTTNHIENPR